MTDQSLGTGASRYLMQRPAVAAAAGEAIDDGAPFSAADAMHITNNLGVLHRESARQLFNDAWGGNMAKDGDGGYTLLTSSIPALANRTDETQLIAWTRNVSRRYGPFFIPADRTSSDGARWCRTIRATVNAYSDGAATVKVIVAVTQSANPPSEGYLTYGLQSLTTATPTQYGAGTGMTNTASPSFDMSFRPPATTTRYPYDGVGGVSDAHPVWIWVGLNTLYAGATQGIVSAAAWELAP